MPFGLEKLPTDLAAALAPMLADAEKQITDSVRAVIQSTQLKGSITIQVDLSLAPKPPAA